VACPAKEESDFAETCESESACAAKMLIHGFLFFVLFFSLSLFFFFLFHTMTAPFPRSVSRNRFECARKTRYPIFVSDSIKRRYRARELAATTTRRHGETAAEKETSGDASRGIIFYFLLPPLSPPPPPFRGVERDGGKHRNKGNSSSLARQLARTSRLASTRVYAHHRYVGMIDLHYRSPAATANFLYAGPRI